MWEQVEKVLDEYVRPSLRQHLGELKITRIEGNTVYVCFLGACANCGSSFYTLDELVEKEICARVPGIEHVEQDDFDVGFYNEVKQFLQQQKEKENNN